MASFKLTIAEPKSGKCYNKEVKDQLADSFVGLNIGESISGDKLELPGFEFQITGGSDKSGFPMRKGILGTRKSLVIFKGVGFKGVGQGIRKRKTVCGHKINENTSQINLKVSKDGDKKLGDLIGGEPKADESGEAPKEEPKVEDKKEEPKAEEKKEESKAEEKKEEEPKVEEKKE
tara:strand:+ start:1178 stop:1705 length:528 start_codon:yes stop_codon:yes gene_type:complete